MARVDKNFLPLRLAPPGASEGLAVQPECELRPQEAEATPENFPAAIVPRVVPGSPGGRELPPDVFCELLKQAQTEAASPKTAEQIQPLPPQPQLPDADRLQRLAQDNERLRDIHAELVSRLVALEKEAERNAALAEERAADMKIVCGALSREFHGPLNDLAGRFQKFFAESFQALDENARGQAYQMTETSAGINRLFPGLLRFTQISSEQPCFENVSVAGVVSSVIGRRINLIAAKRAEVRSDGAFGEVVADAVWLEEILGYLLDNAIKFVAPNVLPRVRIWSEALPGFVRLHVQDNGVGIHAEDRERIFGLFVRVHNDHPGTGVGLALVRKAVDCMQGRCGVESAPGRGSRFWIDLPCAE